MNQEDSRLWLSLDKVRKELYRIKFHYIGTQDRTTLEDMIIHVERLLEKLEKR